VVFADGESTGAQLFSSGATRARRQPSMQ